MAYITLDQSVIADKQKFVQLADGSWAVRTLDASPGATQDTNNSTDTALSSGQTFTGTATDISDYSAIGLMVYTDVNSAADGLVVQYSFDGSDWHDGESYTIPANSTKFFTPPKQGKYYRVSFTNNGDPQTDFHIHSLLSKYPIKWSSHNLNDNLNDDDDAELVASVLKLRTAQNTYTSGAATNNGNFKVSLEEYDGSLNPDPILRIANGEQTGASKINKFGAAPDFDTGDGEVTVWDGAEDATAWELMNYVYSTTADIDSISSDNAGDTQDIEIQGLDTNGALTTQTITLQGQTRVPLTTNLKRVFRAKNVGSTDLAGHVFVYVNGTLTGGIPNTNADIRAIIHPENNQTEMAIYTVPAGKKAYICGFYGSTAGAVKSSNYILRLKARPDGQVFQLKHKLVVTETSPYMHKYCMYNGPFTAGTDIEMTVQTTATGVTAANFIAGMDIVLVDE